VIKIITYLYCEKVTNMKKLPFYFTDDIHLKKYTTTEDDASNKVRRDPKFKHVEMDLATWANWNDGKFFNSLLNHQKKGNPRPKEEE